MQDSIKKMKKTLRILNHTFSDLVGFSEFCPDASEMDCLDNDSSS